MRNKHLAILTISCLIFSGSALAGDRSYNRSYEGYFNPQYPSYQEPSHIEYNQANQQRLISSGERLHDEAIKFMQKAQTGRLSPEQRQMFNSVQHQANDLIRRLQNGQLSPKERAAFEAVQKQMRNPLTY